MDFSDPLYLLAGLLAIGVVAQLVATRLRIPAIVLLLATGLVLGPLLGVLDPDELLGDLLGPFVSLAVGLVLFEGGLSLRVVEAKRLGAPLWWLVFGQLVITFVVGTLLARWVAGFTWATSAVVAAILTVTGPTVIKPMLRQARLARRPSQLLKWESIVNDPLGALLAVVALEVAITVTRPESVSEPWWIIPLSILAAAAGGALAAWLFGRAMDTGVVPEHLKVPATFGGVVAVFAGGEALYHEAGLLAVTVMGVVLANVSSPNVESIRHFKDDVATILVSLLFLLLAASLSIEDLQSISLGMVLFAVAVLFVLRPLAVWLSLGATNVPWQEKLLIGWIAPRGVVAAAMGGALAPRLASAGFADADALVPMLFLVILATVVIHGLTVAPLARRLGIAARGEGGLLIVGAEPWTIDLALALRGAGAEVVIVDQDFRNVVRARMRGVEAVFGDVLSEDVVDELPVERLSWVLAATGDDSYNSLVCVSLSKLMGREHMLQLTESRGDGAGGSKHLHGRRPWGDQGRFAAFAARYWSDRQFKSTALGDGYAWADFLAQDEPRIAVFAVDDDGLDPIDGKFEPAADARIVYQQA